MEPEFSGLQPESAQGLIQKLDGCELLPKIESLTYSQRSVWQPGQATAVWSIYQSKLSELINLDTNMFLVK